MSVDENFDEVIRQARAAARVTGDLRPFGEEIAAETRAEVQAIFDAEGRGLWPETKRRNRTGIRLQDTREYYRGATERDHPGHFERIDRDEVEIGVDLEYYRRIRGVPYPVIVENRFRVYGQLDERLTDRIEQEIDVALQREINQVFD